MIRPMIWWGWTNARQWAFLGGLYAVGTLPGLLLALIVDIADEWQLVLGSGLLFLLPLMLCWYLFVGLRTGRIPTRFGSDDRQTSPLSFWLQVVLYAGALAYLVWIFFSAATYTPVPGK